MYAKTQFLRHFKKKVSLCTLMLQTLPGNFPFNLLLYTLCILQLNHTQLLLSTVNKDASVLIYKYVSSVNCTYSSLKYI